MKKIYSALVAIVIILITITSLHAQNTFPSSGSVGIGTASPNASAILDVKSTTQGFLTPRMTFAQRNVIATPATGLLIYQTNSTPGYYYYNGTAWTAVTNTYTAGTGISVTGTTITNTAPDKTVSLTAGSGISVTGTYPNFTIASSGGGSSPWLTNGTNVYYNGGNVGIGTNSPLYRLQVNGDINQSTGSVLRIGGTQVFKADNTNSNLLIGKGTGTALTGKHNVAIGNKALNKYTQSFNTAIGDSALSKNTDDGGGGSTNNTAVGYAALAGDVNGIDNVAVGNASLAASTTSFNTSLGSYALNSQTSGGGNTAIGNSAMQNNTSGSDNVAIGRYALGSTANTGNYNVASGFYTLTNNTSGSQNTAEGLEAGYVNSTGSYNVYLGSFSGYPNTSGSNNICLGAYSSIADGINNSVVIGYGVSTSLSNSIVIGSTSQHVGIGNSSPYSSSQLSVNGGSNYYSIYTENHNTSGGIAILGTTDQGGGYGMYGSSTGSTSTLVNVGVYGYATGSTLEVVPPGSDFGYSANYGLYGDAGSGFAGGFNGEVYVTGDVYSASDQKLKKNVTQLKDALSRLDQLSVKEYDFNQDEAKQNKMNLPAAHQFGFIAQDVQKIFPNLVAGITAPIIDHSAGINQAKTIGSTDFLAVNYMGFIPILTKAVQELTSQNDSLTSQNQNLLTSVGALQNDNSSLHQQLDALTTKMNQFESALSQCCSSYQSSNTTSANQQLLSGNLSGAQLSQNIPNPFNQTSFIKFYIPSTAKNASIIVSDLTGEILQQFTNFTTGYGQVTIHAGSLAAGTYQYSLIIDGVRMDTKQMILVR